MTAAAGTGVTRDLAAEGAPARRSLLRRLPLYFHTLRHLQAGQIAAQLKRRLLPPRLPTSGPAVTLRSGLRFEPFLPAPEAATAPASAPGEIRFVGRSRPFALPHPDWVAADAPKLWRYNLQYFDFLGGTAFSPGEKALLIDDWIARVPVGATDAWEPYPVSLRVVNWLKYLLTFTTGAAPSTWTASLSHQLAALEGDLEYHLLANHLLKNGKALAFAGVCLEGPAAARWLALGLDILAAEAAAQVLPDGGHVERSPMYHCIVLEDFLDVVNLLTQNPGLVPEARIEPLRAAALRATGFLRAIRTGAGDIPLFNDAAFGITRSAAELLAYAERVLGATLPPDPAADRIELKDSGYFGYRQGGDSLIVDCGPVGPDYQPGHAHCDTLSCELHVGGVPILVDSGTFDYEPGPFRHYLRSTAAHNTVRIDGEEQSEIWGAFRVARRARPLAAQLGDWTGDTLVFNGAHDGYRRLTGQPVHHRHIRVDRGRRWEIRDRVTGAGRHRVESFLHLHPAVRVEPAGEREFRLLAPGGVALRLTFGPAGTLHRVTGYYCPEFGVRLASGALVLEHAGALPVDFRYVFERL